MLQVRQRQTQCPDLAEVQHGFFGVRPERAVTHSARCCGTIAARLKLCRSNMTSSKPRCSARYDLKQLFIGGEGTLGVVTGVALLAAPKWASVNVVYLAVPSWEAAQKVPPLAALHRAARVCELARCPGHHSGG